MTGETWTNMMEVTVKEMGWLSCFYYLTLFICGRSLGATMGFRHAVRNFGFTPSQRSGPTRSPGARAHTGMWW